MTAVAEKTVRPAAVAAKLPLDVELVLTAMDAAAPVKAERRATRRTTVHQQAALRLFVDQPGHASRILYTRDCHARGLGFISRDRLPLGYGGVIDLVATDGSILSIACTLLRCRPTADGWYEGVVHFNRDQTGIEEMLVTA